MNESVVEDAYRDQLRRSGYQDRPKDPDCRVNPRSKIDYKFVTFIDMSLSDNSIRFYENYPMRMLV